MVVEWRLIDGGDGYWLHVPCGERCRWKGQQHGCATLTPVEPTMRPNPAAAGTTTGQNHPTTSHQAAARVAPKSGTQRYRVLQLLFSAWPDGYTDEEMQQMLDMNPSSQRPRRQELQRGGWLVDAGYTRRTASGADATVWRYVPLNEKEEG